jgi:hypothetical protein
VVSKVARSSAKLLTTSAVFYAIYLLYASTLAPTELVVGIGATVVSTIAAGVFGATGIVQFRPRLRDLLQCWRIPWYSVEGTVELFRALARQLFTTQGAQSLVRAVPFAVGKDDDPQAIARRALAVAYTTMTPNFIVFGVARNQALLLYHQVLSGPVLKMTINLGANP